MAGALLIGLPEAPLPDERDLHWWHVVDGAIVERGIGSGWMAIADGAGTRVTGLAPAAAVRLVFGGADTAGATGKQAAAVARIEAVDTSLGDSETLHAVSAPVGDQGAMVTAVVANAAMLQWIDWARSAGVDLHHIVPAAALLPLGDEWLAAAVGSDRMIARRGAVIPNEPAIVDTVTSGDPVREFGAEELDALLVAAASEPPLDLRTGRFARRRRLIIDRGRFRELALLAALIPLISLAWALVSIAKLNGATAQIDRETVEIAEAALGRPVSLENAEAELAQTRGSTGLTAPLAALYQRLQSEQGVSATQIGYGSGGTFSTTLAAPSVNDINRVLIALQRDGYRVTAIPRQAPDGRAMVDLTMRVGP